MKRTHSISASGDLRADEDPLTAALEESAVAVLDSTILNAAKSISVGFSASAAWIKQNRLRVSNS